MYFPQMKKNVPLEPGRKLASLEDLTHIGERTLAGTLGGRCGSSWLGHASVVGSRKQERG